MSSNSRWLAVWPALPLALALSGVGLRLHVATPASRPPAPANASPFTPPPWLLAAAHGGARDATFSVDSERSSAFVSLADGTQLPVVYEVQGRLRLLADEAFGGAEILLVPRGAKRAFRALRVQIGAAQTSSSPIAGFHASSPAAQLSSNGERLPIDLRATWIRLPGGRLHLHAVSEPEDGLADRIQGPRGGQAPWARNSRAVLSLAVELVEPPAR